MNFVLVVGFRVVRIFEECLILCEGIFMNDYLLGYWLEEPSGKSDVVLSTVNR